MKNLWMFILAVGTIFIIQVVDLEAALLPNEIKIQVGAVKHGPEFGSGWSAEQKNVWDKTQEWWQLRMGPEWDKLKLLYHKDATLYHYFHKVPFDFSLYEELAKENVFNVAYCTVHQIRVIENIAVVFLYYEILDPIPPKRMIFVWMKQGEDWKLVSTMNKEEQFSDNLMQSSFAPDSATCKSIFLET